MTILTKPAPGHVALSDGRDGAIRKDSMVDGMTKGERTELGQLIRKQERVMKAAASERSAKLMAEFEQQMDETFSFNDDAVWKAAFDSAKEIMAEANRRIAARAAELGIPAEFAPSLAFGWMERGQNAAKSRREELRRIAKRKIEAMETEARTKIEGMSLGAQTEVITHGMKSDAARAFLEKMPSLDSLMPSVTQADIAKLLPAKRIDGQMLIEGRGQNALLDTANQ